MNLSDVKHYINKYLKFMDKKIVNLTTDFESRYSLIDIIE